MFVIVSRTQPINSGSTSFPYLFFARKTPTVTRTKKVVIIVKVSILDDKNSPITVKVTRKIPVTRNFLKVFKIRPKPTNHKNNENTKKP